MHPSKTSKLALLLAASALFSSCARSEQDEPDGALSAQALHERAPRSTYFRCDTNDWRRDEQTRLQPDTASGLLSLTYDVAASGEARCLFTVTHDHLRASYGSKSDVEVPGSGQLSTFFGFALPFHVSYPAPGQYRVTVDWAHRSFELAPTGPSLEVFSSIPFFGDTESYAPLHGERWSTPADEGDVRYALIRSDYAQGANGTLGEYSLVRERSYADLLFSARVRSSEDLAANPAADFAVVYGFSDPDNYSYMLFSSDAAQTQLVRVMDGVPIPLAVASRPGIVDQAYHGIALWRHGAWIRVLLDESELLSVNDPYPLLVGAVGLGSLDDAALFDDVEVASYLDINTPHFHVTMPSNLAAYQDSVTSLLENAFVLSVANTGWDINQRLGQPFYEYLYRPSGWRWFNDANGCCELGGGLSLSGGPSAVLSEVILQSKLPATDSLNLLVAISLHELGNGWFLPGPAPAQWVEWLRSESHSGFLRAENELDMGYCADAHREHNNHYADYVGTSLDDRRLLGASVEPLLVSLRERYGWGPFRAVYDATLSGQLDYLGGLSSDQRDDEMVLFLSQQVGESLIDFFERELGIQTSDTVRAALADLPVSDLTVLASLPCHTPTLRATPSALMLEADAANPTPSGTLYVQAPSAWEVSLAAPASWLSLTRTDVSDATTIVLRADASELPPGTSESAEVVLTGSGLADSPLHIPVSLHVQ